MPETTLKEKAYQELKRQIMNGVLKPGDFLTERSLADSLQMSRTPIRSAVEKLESDGLVNYLPNKGIYISQMSIKKVIDFFDFRIAIEPYVIRKLTEHKLSEEAVEYLQQNLKAQQQCLNKNNFVEFTALDSEFHRYLSRLYGNEEIHNTMNSLQDKLYQIALSVLKKDNSRIQVSYNDHLHILNAIIKGDADEGEREMIQHLEFGKRILLF